MEWVSKFLSLMSDCQDIEGAAAGLVDFYSAGCVPLQSVFADVPRFEANAAGTPDNSFTQDIVDYVMSWAFKDRLAACITKMKPDKYSHIFVHIPKTGGTSINNKYKKNDDFLRLLNPSQIGPLTDLQWRQYLNDVAVSLKHDYYSFFFFLGHIRMNDLVKMDLIRDGAYVFSVIREPDELVLSWINMILEALAASPSAPSDDPEGRAHAREFWIGQLRIEEGALERRNSGWLVEIILEKLITPNVMCDFLGHMPTAASALDMTRERKVELIPLPQIDDYFIRRGWTPSRDNPSPPIVGLRDLSPGAREKLRALTSEDRKFYDAVISRA